MEEEIAGQVIIWPELCLEACTSTTSGSTVAHATSYVIDNIIASPIICGYVCTKVISFPDARSFPSQESGTERALIARVTHLYLVPRPLT